VAIGMGLGIGLDKWVILPIVLAGGVASVFVATFFGQKIEYFIQTKIKKKKPNEVVKPKTGLIYKIWDKYGMVGIGLIGTFFFGPPIAIGVATSFGANLKKMIPLCLVAVVARCITFTFFGDLIKQWIKTTF
jgi:hypothetical protein